MDYKYYSFNSTVCISAKMDIKFPEISRFLRTNQGKYWPSVISVDNLLQETISLAFDTNDPS